MGSFDRVGGEVRSFEEEEELLGNFAKEQKRRDELRTRVMEYMRVTAGCGNGHDFIRHWNYLLAWCRRRAHLTSEVKGIIFSVNPPRQSNMDESTRAYIKRYCKLYPRKHK